jgi:predicted 2-oxoglutarate/Fe(II)-dependent dioxygenase YbiX
MQAFPRGCGSASLRVSDARLVKYNASAEQTELGMHRDGPLVTATITLNHRDEYSGGGTLIEALAGGEGLAINGDGDMGGGVQRVPRGHVILHPGAIRHGGQPITRGLRYVLVLFIMDADVVDFDRYCVMQANVRGHGRASACTWPHLRV